MQYGAISQEELSMEHYEEDKEAEAVVLFDNGESYFARDENGFKLIFKRHTRLKIFTKAGFSYAEIEIPYYHEGRNWERVNQIEATTYNQENGILNSVSIDKDDIYEIKNTEFWTTKKFALPNVKEGSIIEYKYSIESPYLFNLQDWQFQHRIPTIYSKYTLKMIPFYSYKWILQGTDNLDVAQSYEAPGLLREYGNIKYKEMVHEYAMRDVPAFKDESFITSVSDYIIKMDFQLAKIYYPSGGEHDIMSTWPKMVEDLLRHEDFGKYIRRCKSSVKKNISPSQYAMYEETERFNKIMNFFKKTYKWNGHNGKMASQSPKSLLKTHTGNSAEINLMLISALQQHGFKARPVILSTRDHGLIRSNYPFQHLFNYVIALVEVDGNLVLADATDPFCPNKQLPQKCLNGKGLIIDKDKQEWVKLTNNIPATRETQIKLRLDDDNEFVGFISKSYSSYDALRMRKSYFDKTEELKKDLDQDGLIITGEIKSNNFEKLELPYHLNYEISYRPEKIDSVTFVSPFLGYPLSENPLKSPYREYPIDMEYAKKRRYNSFISFPSGTVFESLPENESMSDDLIDLTFSIDTTHNDDGVELFVKGYYHFKYPVYKPEYSSRIKYYFDIIVEKFNEQVAVRLPIE